MQIKASNPMVPSDYPPKYHMLRALGISLEFQSKEQCTARMPVVPQICTDLGTVHVGVLATLVDLLGGGIAARVVYPDWIATADLCIYTTGRARLGTVSAVGSVIRAGQTTVVIDVDIREEANHPVQVTKRIGAATMTLSRLPKRKGNPEFEEDSTMSFTFAAEQSRLSQSYLDTAGIRVRDSASGLVELKMSGYVRNSFGALQGGMVAVLVDVAGQHAARVVTGKPLTTNDLTIHFLSQGKIGPFITKAEVFRKAGDIIFTRTEVIDRGANDRLLALGINTAWLD